MSLSRSSASLVTIATTVALFAPSATNAQNISGISAPRSITASANALVEGTTDEQRIAVPVAVGADLGSGDQKGVAPAVGFQVWKDNNYFLGAFFTLAATDETVKDGYGAFVLNPPLKGRSFSVSGSYFLNRKSSHPVLFGVGGRWATTSSNFEFTPTGGTATKASGFGLTASVTAQIVSRTLRVPLTDGEKTDFQIGVEFGPSWRVIGGDLSSNDAFRKQLLGTDKTSFAGFETTFFIRLNAVQPFARFSSFGRPDGVVIPGMTGNQVVWGVNVASALFNTKTGS